MNERCALVTGASRGIGAEIARRLDHDGYNLTLAARHESGLTRMAEALRQDANVEIHLVVADLASEDDTRRVALEHAARFGRLDLMVLNAGLGMYAPIADTTLGSYDLTFTVNVRAGYVLVQELLPLLRKTASTAPDRGAKVIAIASIAGVFAEAGLAAYGASKAALISLCDTITLEECVNGITATALSPGYVETDMTAWIPDPRPPMITTGDVAELMLAVSPLSANAAVTNVVIARRDAEPQPS